MTQTPEASDPDRQSDDQGVDQLSVDQHSVDQRAELLPEEQVAGSEDPDAQARAILEESGERTDHPEETRAESTQTPDAPDPDRP